MGRRSLVGPLAWDTRRAGIHLGGLYALRCASRVEPAAELSAADRL